MVSHLSFLSSAHCTPTTQGSPVTESVLLGCPLPLTYALDLPISFKRNLLFY